MKSQINVKELRKDEDIRRLILCMCYRRQADGNKLSIGALVFPIFIFAHLQPRNANIECFFSDELDVE